MRDSLLQPRNNFINGSHALFSQIAVHFVAKPDLESAIPEPANSHVDFAVVDFLQFAGKFHTSYIKAGVDSDLLLQPGLQHSSGSFAVAALH